ncbi:MAG: hypothetical protein OXT65_04980 [Alphaproteobacteria bacterium]|nr:hypothetical protein [Alphaproteobacteria bacterium]
MAKDGPQQESPVRKPGYSAGLEGEVPKPIMSVLNLCLGAMTLGLCRDLAASVAPAMDQTLGGREPLISAPGLNDREMSVPSVSMPTPPGGGGVFG